MTAEEFTDFVIGLFFNLQIANYDTGITIAENVMLAISGGNENKE